jgi:hypothetical protein
MCNLEVDRLHLAQIKCLEFQKGAVRESQCSTGSLCKAGYVSLPKFREALMRIVVRNPPNISVVETTYGAVVLTYHYRGLGSPGNLSIGTQMFWHNTTESCLCQVTEDAGDPIYVALEWAGDI